MAEQPLKIGPTKPTLKTRWPAVAETARPLAVEPWLVGLVTLLAGLSYLASVGPGHDWGGDFAQYLLQAQNIAHGQVNGPTGYLYNPSDPSLGPERYPPGFPLLLAPLIYAFGLSFIACKIEISLLLALCLPLLWLLFRPALKPGYRLALLLLFGFSPWLLAFKENILSDIPFLGVIYLYFVAVTLIYDRRAFSLAPGALLAGLILLATLIRTPGLLLIPALPAYALYRRRQWPGFSLTVAAGASGLVLLSRLIFAGERAYLDQFAGWQPQTSLTNLVDYVKELTIFWPRLDVWPESRLLLFALATLFAVVGLFFGGQRRTAPEFFLLFYLPLILVWPARQGLRFLLPLLPVYLFYMLLGLQRLSGLLPSRPVRRTALAGLSVATLLIYGWGWSATRQQIALGSDGPFSAPATEMFTFIEQHAAPAEVVVFRRPRVLVLFSGHSATSYPRQPGVDWLAYFTETGVTSVVVDLAQADDAAWLSPFIARHPALFQQKFSNERFRVFAFAPPGEPNPATVTPFFPLGFMGLATEAQFPAVAAAGFNIVYEFRSIEDIDEATDYLNQAEAAGLKVVQNMPECRAYASGDPLCARYEAEVWSEAEWASFISTLASHDNLAAWFLPDEITDYAAAANLYDYVQRYDPARRPVFANPGSWELPILSIFPPLSDFIWTAAYPEHGGYPRAIVTYAMRQDALVCRPTGTRWGAILQFFDSAEFGSDGGYPTPAELRSDSYQAIIGGATGLWYFSYENEIDPVDRAALLAEMAQIAAEITGPGGLDRVIQAAPTTQTITKRLLAGPSHSPVVPIDEPVSYDSLQTLQKEYQGTYLFAVNIATESVTVAFDNLPETAATVQVLFEERTLPVSEGSFSDTFAPDEVHIYFSEAVQPGSSLLIYLPLIMK